MGALPVRGSQGVAGAASCGIRGSALGVRELSVSGSHGVAGAALSRHQRGCAGRGLSPRPLCVPGSGRAAGVARSRHQGGCAGGGLSPRPPCVPGPESVANVALLETEGVRRGDNGSGYPVRACAGSTIRIGAVRNATFTRWCHRARWLDRVSDPSADVPVAAACMAVKSAALHGLAGKTVATTPVRCQTVL